VSSSNLSLEQALTIAQATLQVGIDGGYAPLCVAVLDSGGNVLTLLRDERASLYRPQIAIAKASGCLGMGFGGRELARRAQAIPQFCAVKGIESANFVPDAGGALPQTSNQGG
jgi:uncharacterized protein GlcG (DUF336 family)